ncbi:MAG: IS1182 family transposase [Acidobacteria bacterium]|nr:IS1182 family transposase [Acidobacteriota bacterium]
MSLHPQPHYTVPEQTARTARAAFPKGTMCMRIYDQLGTIFQDQDFADLFPHRGQPAQAPFRLALITILQFLEGLSDRNAADAVRARIDWKYLLCLELDDPGFDYSVLCEFRSRLLEGGAERRLFDHVLSLLHERKLVQARTRQRTDSTHVVAAVRDLNRLERVVETLRAALNVLATVEPSWIRTNIPAEWVDRYGRRAEENRFPAGDKERGQFAEVVGRDGYALLDAIWSADAPAWMRALPAVETLRQVWLQSFMPVEDSVRLRQTDNVPPSALRISSPYDTQARYAHKRSTSWVGYKVHVTETCDEETPHIITNVHTDEAVVNDNDALPKIHQGLSDAELLPDKHLVDAGYVEAQQLVESRREYGMELIGPVQGNGRWQHEQGTGFDISHFVIDWERAEATCPEGKKSSSWKAGVDGRGNEVINVAFAKADCVKCSSLPLCTKSKIQRRTINIKPQELHEALQQGRQRERTEGFKEEYRKRAGVEGTISQGVRAFGMRRSRYIGRAKTHLQHLATAAAINIERVADWIAGVDREKTRRCTRSRVLKQL